MDWVGRRSTENRVLSPSMRHQRMYSDILGWRENKTGRRGGREMRGCGGGNRIKCLSASINNYNQTKSSHVVPGFLVMCTVRVPYLISIATLARAVCLLLPFILPTICHLLPTTVDTITPQPTLKAAAAKVPQRQDTRLLPVHTDDARASF
jgi:hypothetical protein